MLCCLNKYLSRGGTHRGVGPQGRDPQGRDPQGCGPTGAGPTGSGPTGVRAVRGQGYLGSRPLKCRAFLKATFSLQVGISQEQFFSRGRAFQRIGLVMGWAVQLGVLSMGTGLVSCGGEAF